MKTNRPILSNNRGNLAVDFLFGMTICFVCMAVFFAMSFSLSMIEVAQYIGFASARTYNAGHIDPSVQEERAFQKFDRLVNTSIFKNLFKETGWFELKFIGARNFVDQFPAAAEARDIFVGTQLSLTANMLDMQLPLVGNSSNEGPFTTNINAFLGREPSTQECLFFFKEKYNLFTNLGYTIPGGETAVLTMVDNGC